MDSVGNLSEIRSPEVQELAREVIRLKGELRQIQQQQQAAAMDVRLFHLFSEEVRDFALITFDPDRRIESWSRGAERLFGYTKDEAIGQLVSMIFTPEDRAAGADELELAAARRDGSAEDDRWHLRRDGTCFWATGVLTAHRGMAGQVEKYSKVMRDLTSRKLLEDRLAESEERFRLFSANVSDYALIPLNTDGNVSGWNPGAESTLGYAEAEILGRSTMLFFTPEDQMSGESRKDLECALAEGCFEDSRWLIRRNQTRFWAHWITTPMYDPAGKLRGFAKVLRDETKRKEAENLAATALMEKDLLLREIHHRVKNNLHVITSLLSLQAGQSDDPKLQTVLTELQDRIRAIAALHETLYGSRDLANIDFGPYMQNLLRDLVASHGIDDKRIQVLAESDDVVLSTEQALPLGLIVNELVANSLKHAFPDGRKGSIDVRFRYLPETLQAGQTLDSAWCELCVKDDGVGIAEADGIWERKSMGLRIVHLFTAQLHGEVSLNQTHQTQFTVRFPLEYFQ